MSRRPVLGAKAISPKHSNIRFPKLTRDQRYGFGSALAVGARWNPTYNGAVGGENAYEHEALVNSPLLMHPTHESPGQKVPNV
ncbi:hypothetical protein F4809DRAFT_638526 [Biscogniauxia mediterranea]|nr:hypothetical protein F4809DRAFT_638526 [Biscogniauxia mediterranea]